METSTPARLILLVEDRPDRVHMIADVLRGSSVPHHLITLDRREQVLDYLRRRGNYTDAVRPDLILLNLDLTHQDGLALLGEIKNDPILRRTPIVVLTNAMTQEDILGIYALQGNCCTVAAEEIERLSQIVKRIEEFWLGIVTLPSE
jgi:chemotaxis family two-component system response regulator Rcp1